MRATRRTAGLTAATLLPATGPRGGLTSVDKGHGLVDVVRSAGLI